MEFLLAAVNAKYIHSNPAVYSLRTYAGVKYENNIRIAEYTINNRTDEILSDIYERKPDVIAFSCYIWNWRMIMELTAELHKIMPKLPIWLGGPEVSYDAEKIMRELSGISGIMIGEGEQTFLELLEFYLDYFRSNSRSSLSELIKIEGIVYRNGRDITETAERRLTDISKLPFLYEKPEAFHNRIIYYESSRGCPFRCSYCLSSIDKTVRFKNIETVKKELQFFLDHKMSQVKFIDRTFNCNHDHAMAVWIYINEHDNGVTNFHFEIAADIMREEELTLLSQMRPGLVQMEIGVQSANACTLKEINRYTDMEKLKRNVERIRDCHNIHVHLDLIAGLPYEDYESFGTSFDAVYSMQPEQLQLGFLKVLKGSPMYEKADRYGINYTSGPPYEVLYSRWLSFEEISRLKRIEEMVELYYNSNQFTYTLRVLDKAFASPFEMFEKLAAYYKEKGYFVKSPARAYRYEVLLDFARTCDKDREELYKELLTFDIYLRENMKSRPVFAYDIMQYKDTIRDFYKDGERVRILLPSYSEYQTGQIMRMTHMEVFYYPVWNITVNNDKQREAGQLIDVREYKRSVNPVYLLFDYSRRNPLTHEAEIIKINEQNTE